MDLKKLFVYVPSASEASFITSVINVPAEAAKYANKIVFLGNSKRIWVKGEYYGCNPEDIDAIWTALGITKGTTPSGEYTYGEGAAAQTFAYADFAEWISALKSYVDAKVAGEIQKVVTAYEAADAAIITSYEAADAALEAKLPGVAVDGSGLSLTTDVDPTTGKTTYTITADQSIWEFMGTAEATTATVAQVLDAKYGEGEGKVHREKEAGDVWAVTLTDHATRDTVLYAYDGTSWVLIGSAQGVSGVDTTVTHGVNLTINAAVVGINVVDGSIAAGETKLITGATAYTKFNEVITAYETADAAIITSYEAADAAIITSYEAADAAIITSYEAADAAIKTAMTTSVNINTDDASYMSIADTASANGHSYEISFNEQNMFNYVTENIWETYQAS